jgi:hypothetical protein
MARPLRIGYNGAVYHVTSRGNERKTFLMMMTAYFSLNTLNNVNEKQLVLSCLLPYE